jgi:hypothetical protein
LWYKTLKLLVIGSAGLFPFLAGSNAPARSTGGLGVTIAILEGIQQLN